MKVKSKVKKTFDHGVSRIVGDTKDKFTNSKEENLEKVRFFQSDEKLQKSRELDKLEENILTSQHSLSNYISRYNKWTDNPMIIRNQADIVNYLYCIQLDIACQEFLTQEYSMNTIAYSLGMSLGMRIASKKYNEYKKIEREERRLEGREKFAESVDKIAAFSIPFGFVNENGEIVTGMEIKAPGAKVLKSFADWRMNKTKEKAHGGTLPLTSEGAAITYMGLAKSAYRDMRESGANVDDIYAKFNAAKKMLYEQAKYDGVSKIELNKQVREIAVKMAEKYPDMSIYKEINDEIVIYKNGKFIKKDGSEFTDAFTPRKPISKETYKENLEVEFNDMYSECKSMKEISELDFNENGLTEKIDRLKGCYCSDHGENKEDITKVSSEFNDLAITVAMEQLEKWADMNPKRREEFNQYFGVKNEKKSSFTVPDELMEVSGMENDYKKDEFNI